jgi:hypothetical protein
MTLTKQAQARYYKEMLGSVAGKSWEGLETPEQDIEFTRRID